jgi:PAS domain-containing protein
MKAKPSERSSSTFRHRHWRAGTLISRCCIRTIREESRKVWSTCLRTGEAGEVSFRVRDAQGGYRWFLSRAEPLRASGGTLLQWVGVNLDIEELMCAEQALRESEAKFRDYAESASDFGKSARTTNSRC